MKKHLSCFSVLLAILGCSSVSNGDRKPNLNLLPAGTCESIEGFFKGELDEYQTRVDEAGRVYNDEQWKMMTASPGASAEAMSAAYGVMQKIVYDKAILEQAQNLSKLSKDLDPTKCAWKTKLERAKAILEASILVKDEVVKKEKENQDTQDKIDKQNGEFRLTVDGEKEPISTALLDKKIRSTDDRATREKLFKQYIALRSQKWIDWGFRDLVKARNLEGKAAGFRNYRDYKFFRAQLDMKDYDLQVRALKNKFVPTLKRLLADMGKAQKIKKLEGWDVGYLREKNSAGEINLLLKDLPADDVMAVAKEFWSGLGIGIESYHFTMDLYPKTGKSAHAFAFPVVVPHVNANGDVLPEPKADIRLLANLIKPVKWNDISTMVHELGHCIHTAEIRQPIGVFRSLGSVDTEAIAMTTERMAASPEFIKVVLTKFAHVSNEAVEPILKKLDRALRIEAAMVIMRQVMFSEFEKKVYENPDLNLAKVWTQLYLEYFGVQLDPKYAAWDIEHFVVAPVYVQNYAIGKLMVEQLYQSMLKEFNTSYQSKALGQKLKTVYFSPGVEFNYLELTKRFSGAPFSADYALKLLEGL